MRGPDAYPIIDVAVDDPPALATLLNGIIPPPGLLPTAIPYGSLLSLSSPGSVDDVDAGVAHHAFCGSWRAAGAGSDCVQGSRPKKPWGSCCCSCWYGVAA